ncbi:unnamed protein product, partial [Prorocentrum cordatum]
RPGQRGYSPRARFGQVAHRGAQRKGRRHWAARRSPGDAELAILNKAVQDGEEQLQIQSSEVPTVELIKSGARDFIDYALTEVDRIVKVDNAGSVTSFDWKSQGHSQDVPALRRSQAEQWVSLEAQLDANIGRNYMRATEEMDASPFDGRRPNKKAPLHWGEAAAEPLTRYSIV